VLDYLKTWFAFDIIASFPYSWIVDFAPSKSSSKITDNSALKTPQLLRLLKIMKFVRILRLLRVLKLQKIMVRFEENVAQDKLNIVIKLLKIFIQIIFIAHWIACFFWVIGDTDDENSWVRRARLKYAPTT
jgi:hypothetical protein